MSYTTKQALIKNGNEAVLRAIESGLQSPEDIAERCGFTLFETALIIRRLIAGNLITTQGDTE